MRVQTGARGGTAERDLSHLRQRVADAARAEANLGRVARELLAEGHGNGVHQVSPARLDDVVKLARLAGKGSLELLERRQQPVGGLRECRKVDSRWKK